VHGESTAKKHNSPVLAGTSLRVYRYLYKTGKPLNIHEIQRGLGLSSPSVSQYHLRKLIDAGLVRQLSDVEGGRFVVDRVVFENMIRIRRSVIPFQITYAVFFATMLAVLLTILRPNDLETPLFVFGVAVTVAGVIIFAYEAAKSSRAQ
jgi:DNA-binding transcriptional ArsR family regulator